MRTIQTGLAISAALLFACPNTGQTGDDAGTPAGSDAGTSTFVAFGSSGTTANLAWIDSPGATGYLIERKTGGGAFAQVLTLDATAVTFLDRGLAPQTSYDYRLTAQGATSDAVREYSATTGDTAPLQTTTDTPVGAPVQQTLGSQGGTVASADGSIQLTLPAGAVPDGTNVTLQTIANPLSQENAAAVSILSGVPFAKDVSLRFNLGDGDSPDTASVALQDAEGVWLSTPATVDATAGTLTVTLAAESGSSGSLRKAASTAGARRVLRFSRFYVYPRNATVRLGSQTSFSAYALFSTDLCDSKADPGDCAWAVEFARILLGSTAVAKGLTQPLPQSQSKSVPNSDGTWSLDPAGDASGTLLVPAGGASVLYTAPNSPPARSNPLIPPFVKLRFTPNAVSGHPAAFSDPATIFFLGSKYHVTADFASGGIGLDEAITAFVTDQVQMDIELTTSPGGSRLVTVSNIKNALSSHTNDHCNDPDVISFTVGAGYELITTSSAGGGYANNILSLSMEGTETLVPATLNFNGFSTTFPGASAPINPFLEVNVDLDHLSSKTQFPTTPATGWMVTIEPLVE
jgi:hypothetical protein